MLMDHRLINLHHGGNHDSDLRVIFFSGIETGNETGSPYDALGNYLDICGNIIYLLNCAPRNPLTKIFFLVIIEALFYAVMDMIICCCMAPVHQGQGRL